MKKLIIILIMASGCSVIHRAEKNPSERTRELLESYYITVENPENNRPGEQDSIIMLIRKEIKK